MNTSLNLTCQKTHILAWANVDDTLSLKINGVKYLGYPKLDKRGGKYWKVDSLNSTSPTQPAELKPELKEEIEIILNKPLSEQTAEDRKKWAEWTRIEALSQKQVKANHATTNPN